MKKLFIAIISDVEGVHGPIVYYIRAVDYFAAEELAREIMLENGFADEDIDDQFDFDIREFREDEVIEA